MSSVSFEMLGEGTYRPFGHVLRDLLIERGMTNNTGNADWSAFSREAGIHYETLRKSVVGERRALPNLMEACAGALGVDPTVFPDYALWQTARQFDPREVGSEQAMENLRRWAEKQA